MRRAKSILVFFLALVLLAGCADGDGAEPIQQSIEGKFQILWDPVTGLSPRLHFIEPLKAAFPDAEFHYRDINRHTDLNPLEPRAFNQYDVVKTDLYADLIVFENTLAPFYFASGYLESLDSLVSADITVHEHLGADLLERAKEIGGGELYALPFAKNGYALYYNKEIFDAFQVPYPTDGMTWDEVFALARTIMDHPLNQGIMALGLQDPHMAFSQLGGRFTNAETGLPDFNEPYWARYAEFGSTVYDVGRTRGTGIYSGFAEGRYAMVAGRYFGPSPSAIGISDGRGLTHQFMAPLADWDMVSFPVFEDAPDTGPAPAYYYVGIPKNSLRKQEAFRLISHLLSDEAQLSNSLNGVISVRSEPEFRERYGELQLRALGKHVEAFLWHRREGTLGPDYDVYMQYHDPFAIFYYFDDESINLVHQKLADIRNIRSTWLEKVGKPE